MNHMPPLVLVEINNPDGLDDPVVTKEDTVTVVTLDWTATPPVRDVADAIRCLNEYKGMHPRIDKTLDRLGRRHRAVPEKRVEYVHPVRLPRDLANALKDRAELEDRPISRVIREAIREYLDGPRGLGRL